MRGDDSRGRAARHRRARPGDIGSVVCSAWVAAPRPPRRCWPPTGPAVPRCHPPWAAVRVAPRSSVTHAAFALSASGAPRRPSLSCPPPPPSRGAHPDVVSGAGALLTRWRRRRICRSSRCRRRCCHDTPAPLMVPVLLTLSRARILPDAAAELGVGTCAASRRVRTAFDRARRPGRQMARLIRSDHPLVATTPEGLTAVAARRWKTQINENAKTPAFFAVSPSCRTTRSPAGASTGRDPSGALAGHVAPCRRAPQVASLRPRDRRHRRGHR